MLSAEVTWEQGTKAIKCDWFSFTTRRKLSQILPLFDFLPLPLVPKQSGLYGYKLSFVSPSGVSVLFSPDRDDIHIQLSGSGVDCCRDFYHLVSLVDSEGADSVSRIDIALDCIGSGVTCSDIWGLLQRGSFSACSGAIRQFEGLVRLDRRTKEDQRRNDHTIYIGSVASERMVRIYDKGAESKTHVDWVRYEIQLRSASAKRFFVLAMKGDLSNFEKKGVELLNKQIRLLDSKKAGGKDVEVMNPFWSWLTDSASPLSLVIPKSAKKICNMMRYVRNATAALKALSVGMPDYAEWIHDAIAEVPLKSSHRQLIDEMLAARVDWESFYEENEDGTFTRHMATGEVFEEFSRRDLDYMQDFPILDAA